MKEEELLRRAQRYLDQLSAGQNPLTGERVPPGDVAAEERLQKCFAYVARLIDLVLRDPSVLDPEARPAPPARERRPSRRRFYAECVELADFPYRESPMTLGEFVRLLNEQVSDPTQRRMPANRVYQWLTAVGILTRSEDGVYSVTEEGADIGFSTAQTKDIHGLPRITVQADREAQGFLIDNIEAISEHRGRQRG